MKTSALTRPAWIESIATVRPDHAFSQMEASNLISRWLESGDNPRAADRARRIFLNAGVQTRHSVEPVEQAFDHADFGARTDRYLHAARILARRAVERALDDANLAADAIDLLITVSCTGFVIPALDAHLLNDLPFRTDIKRLPINALGCAGGAGALARAHDYLKAHPDDRVMVLSVEIPTLTFQPCDFSPAQIVSSALFGDGAAAVILAGDDAEISVNTRAAAGQAVAGGSARRMQVGPAIVAQESCFFRDTLHFMGYTNSSSGFHILLSPEIPAFLERAAGPVILDFLANHGLTSQDISSWIVHPGSRRLLNILGAAFQLNGELDASREILRDNGNLSSATILFVLKRALEAETAQPGAGAGLMVAFGPGFSADLLLLKWMER